MAVKSIIEIEVDDGPFTDFKAAFDKYQKALNESPEAWSRIGKATSGASATLDTVVGELQSINVNIGKMVPGIEKFNKYTRSSGSTMAGMVKSTKSMAGNIMSATESLLKWSGIVGTISGLIGAGGLFGIDRLATSASNSRFQSMGLGISTAELNAANVNYSKAVGDPAGTLGAIRDAQYDLSKRWAFGGMGINPAGKDAGQLLGPMIKAARASFIASGSTEQGAQAHGLTQFFSMDDLVRFKNMSNAEIDAMIKRADADKKALALSDSASRSWQDLKIQIDRAETQIGNTFIKGLLPLTGPLTQLSAAFTQAVADVMKSKDMGIWINDLASGIKSLAAYLTSGAFKSDVSNFMDSIDDAAGAVYNFAEKVGKLFGTGEVTLKGSQYHKLHEISRTDPALASALRNFMENPSRQKYNSSVVQRWVELHPGLSVRGPAQIAATQAAILQRFGLSDATAQSAATTGTTTTGTWNGSARHNPGNLRSAAGYPSVGGFAVFPDDAAGVRAMAAQLRRYGSRGVNTIDSIIGKYAPSGDNNDTGAYIRDVVGQTGFSPNAHLNLNDPKIMASLIAAMTKHEGGKANFTPATVITIMNNTGGNTYASVNQLAH